MNRSHANQPAGAGDPSRDEAVSALFANLVIQSSNMALIFLGRLPHPETGKHETDLESARLFIDQLEMFEVKTRGNLNAEEQKLLTQNLTALRLAFVEAVDRQPAAPPVAKSAPAPAAPSPTPNPPPPPPPASPAPDEAESRKKFTKKY
jgi:hypothetical protein